MSGPTNDQVDAFWGLTADLEQAIDQKAEAASQAEDTEFGRSAFCLLLAFGRCQLFEVPVNPERVLSRLNADAWSAALTWAWVEARRLLEIVREEDWVNADESTTPFVRHSEALDVLKSRLYFQGLWLVVNGADLSRKAAGTLPDHFAQRVRVFEQLLEGLDQEIDSRADYLCVVSETAWPTNVARTLPDDAWQPRPWWLTSRAAEIRQEIVATTGALREVGEPILHRLLAVEFRVADGTKPAHDFVACDDAFTVVTRSSRPTADVSGTPEFQIAADASQESDRIQVAEFSQDRSLQGQCTVRFYIPAGYRGRRINAVAASVPIDVEVVVYEKREEATKYPTQRWRLRMGSIVRDVELGRAPALVANPVTEDWRGSFQLAAGDLKPTIRGNVWPNVYLRRLG